LTSSTTTINYFTQICVEVSPSILNIDNIETIAGTKVERIVWRVKEFLATELIATARTVTNDISFTLNQELRYYENDLDDIRELENHNFGEFVFLNSLGGWDSVFSHSTIIETIEVNQNTFERTIEYPNETSIEASAITNNDLVDNEVLSIDLTKSIEVQIDYNNKENHKYLVELLKSPVIYYRNFGNLQEFQRVSIQSTNYQNIYKETLQSFSVKLKLLLDENTSK